MKEKPMAHETRPGAYEQGHPNLQELADFMQTLPIAMQENEESTWGIRSYFEVDTPTEAAAIQSSVVWLRLWSGSINLGGAGMVGTPPYPGRDFMVRPYWLLGMNNVDAENKQ